MERIIYDWGPHVAPIARAGYEAYVQGRNFRSWTGLRGHETRRWMLAADDLFGYEGIIEPKRIRAVYLTGYERKIVEAWDDLNPEFQRRWWAVQRAMVTARDSWKRQHLDPVKTAPVETITPAPVKQATTVTVPVEKSSTSVTADQVMSLRDRLKQRRGEKAVAGRGGAS